MRGKYEEVEDEGKKTNGGGEEGGRGRRKECRLRTVTAPPLSRGGGAVE